MAKSKLPGSESVKEQNEIFEKAKANFQEIIAMNAKLSQELQSVTQQSSAFFQLAAEGASKAAESMKDFDSSSMGTSQNIGGLSKAIEKQGKALEKANKEAGFKKGGDGRNNVFEQMAKSSKAAKVGITLLTGAFNLLGKAVKGAASIIGGMFDVFTSMLGAIPAIIGGIINFANKMFDSMVQGSEDVRQHMFEVRKALEKVKEKFGDTSKGSAADIKSFVATAVGMYNRFGDSIFASAEDASSFALELAGTGEMATILSDQLKESSKEIIKFAKGLGTTGEESIALMNMAYSSGTDLVEIYKDIGQFSQGMASRLGLNAKVLSKNIQMAAKDVKHFGKATVQAMSESAAYAAKMGVSLDKIVGVLDKFDTFEDAANNVSKLSQAFGVNLDTMKLVEAETPEERLEMLKDSFNAAGKSLDNLSRRELNYAASLIGLDEAATKNLLSAKNQTNSLNDVKDASASVANETKSMGDVLKQVTKDIAMNLKQLTRETKGFFDTFIDGILTGIERTPEMQKIFKNISQALDAVFIAGNKLGAAFVNAFPGVKKMLDALGQFFNPKMIGDMFNGFTASFEKFFKSLRTGTGDVRDLFKDLSKNLTDYFTAQGPAGSEFLQGLKDFWNAIKQVIATAILGIGDVIAEGLSFIADFFEGKRKLPNGKDILASAKGGLGKVGEELSPIGEAAMASFGKIGEQFARIWAPLKESLITSLKEGIDYLWEYLKQKISENKGKLALAGLFGMAASGDGGLLGTLGQGVSMYRTYKQGKQIAELTKLAQAGQTAASAGPGASSLGGAFFNAGAAGAEAASTGILAPVTTAGVAGGLAGGLAGGIAGSEGARILAQAMDFAEDGQEVAGFLGGAAGGAALGAMMGGPVGAVVGAGVGIIYDAGRSIVDATSQMADFQQTAMKSLEDISQNSEQMEIMFGIDPKTGKFRTDEFGESTAMSDEALLDQYGALIGGRSWFSLDSTDAQKIRGILEEKYRAAKQLQEDNAEKQRKLIEEKNKQDKKLKEEAQRKAQEKKDEDEYDAFMKSIGAKSKGPINILTFKQKIAEIDKTAKDVTGGAAKLKENFEAIRNTLSGIKLHLFSENKEDEEAKRVQMKKSLKTLLNLKGFIAAMKGISETASGSAKAFEEFGDPEKESSNSYKIISFTKSQKTVIDSIIKTLSGGDSKPSDAIAKLKEQMSESKTTMDTVKGFFETSLAIPGLIKRISESDIKAQDLTLAKSKIRVVGQASRELMSELQAQFEANDPFAGMSSEDMSLLPEAMTNLNPMGQSIDTVGVMKDFSKFLQPLEDVINQFNKISKMDVDTSGVITSIKKISQAVDAVANSVNTERIEELRKKVTAIRNLQSDLNDLLPEQMTVQVTPSATSESAAVKQSTAAFNPRQNLQINMKFDIVMDSKSLEKALVTRSDSLVVKALTDLAHGTNKSVSNSEGYELKVITTKM